MSLLKMAKEKAKKQPIVKGDKVGRNDPCPCGSGKKYKIAMEKKNRFYVQ